MKFKVGDKVKFDNDGGFEILQRGEGVIVGINDLYFRRYLVHSRDIDDGHDADFFGSKWVQDNDNNWWFTEDELELVESCDDTDEVDMVNEPNHARHKAICEQLNKIYIAKNKDYGNSFGEQYQEYSIISSVIRLDDKMRRLKQITKNGAKVEDETIEDTLLDMANYAIMTLMEIEEESE